MTRYGPMYGPDITFLGVPPCTVEEPVTYADADVVVIGAPFDGGTSHRPGTRFGPSAIRQACYLPHDGSRPSLALRVDGLKDLCVYDAGDVEMFSGDIERSLAALETAVHAVAAAGAIPVVLGGDHSIALPDATGVARHHGLGRVSLVHFDAHADTGDVEFGSLHGHGQPMRRLIESGAVRGDRFLQIGLRGYWPGPDTLAWMAEQRMRSYEMTEVVARGLDTCLTEAFGIATDECEGVFLSVDVDVVDPGMAPGTGTPEPGGFTSRQLLDAVRRVCYELPVVGLDVVEVAPPYDHADITAYLGNRVVLEALSAIARRRHDAAGGPRGTPPSRSWTTAERSPPSLARAIVEQVTEFYHWDEVRAELGGDDEAYEAERARTDAWVSAFHLAEERKRLGLTQRQVAEIMGVTPGRVSQIENGDLDVNEVATLSRYANALGARLRIIFDYGDDLRQIA